jgi:hypothetical protein
MFVEGNAPTADLNQLQHCFAIAGFVDLEQRVRDLVSRFPACGQAWLAPGTACLAQLKPAPDALMRAAGHGRPAEAALPCNRAVKLRALPTVAGAAPL